MEKEFIELVELQGILKVGIGSLFPDRLWVKAEISSVQVKSNGHCYLSLSQTEDGRLVARADAIIWRNRFRLLDAAYRDATGGPVKVGDSVMVLCLPSYSELYGLSLTVDDVEPLRTAGEAEQLRQRTIGRLKEEGLLERQQELGGVAALPRRLAVISARDAAGFGDFCRHIRDNEYGFTFTVDLFEATMQGPSAPASIAAALEDISAVVDGYDAVLLMRGGGSNLDLACFDDYLLCRAIALCPLPVFTAIGHDRDFHIADMVAWRFVKTPTALADEFIDALAREDERIESLGRRLRLAFSAKIAALQQQLDHYVSRIAAADPRSVLSRGYTLLTDAEGVVVKTAAGLSEGQEIMVLLSDGKVRARIEKIER